MNYVKKGDIVSRNSYNNDLLFFIDKIRASVNGGKIAILKGLTIRIEADAPIEDLRKSSEIRINNDMKAIDDIIDCRDVRKKDFYGKILHLDGDCNFVYIMNRKNVIIKAAKKIHHYNSAFIVILYMKVTLYTDDIIQSMHYYYIYKIPKLSI